MYLVSEVKKKTKTGGKGICQVYHMSNTLSIPDNVTQQVADRFGFDYVKGNIEIPYGSGTGFMRIRDALTKGDSSVVVYDVSTF